MVPNIFTDWKIFTDGNHFIQFYRFFLTKWEKYIRYQRPGWENDISLPLLTNNNGPILFTSLKLDASFFLKINPWAKVYVTSKFDFLYTTYNLSNLNKRIYSEFCIIYLYAKSWKSTENAYSYIHMNSRAGIPQICDCICRAHIQFLWGAKYH